MKFSEVQTYDVVLLIYVCEFIAQYNIKYKLYTYYTLNKLKVFDYIYKCTYIF